MKVICPDRKICIEEYCSHRVSHEENSYCHFKYIKYDGCKSCIKNIKEERFKKIKEINELNSKILSKP